VHLNQVAGTPHHTFHPTIESSKVFIPSRLIPEEEKRNLRALAEGCLGAGVGRKFLLSKLGRHISCAKIAFVQEHESIRFGDKSIPETDVEKLLHFFHESREISYQKLWDVPMGNDSSSPPQVTTTLPSSPPAADTSNPCPLLEKIEAVCPTPTTSRISHWNSLPVSLAPTKSPQKLVSTCYDRENGKQVIVDHTEDEPGMEDLLEETRCARAEKSISETARIFLCTAWASV
jgi:hypothetical protein